MIFTVIGFDTEEGVEIYDTVDASSFDTAFKAIRKNWPRANHTILAIYEGEPENLYDPEADPVNDEFEEFEDEEEDEENEEDWD